MGGRREILLIPEGRGGWGWHKFASELRKAKDLLFATVGCGCWSFFSAEKKGGKEEGPGLGMVLNRTEPSFAEVVKSDLCPDVTVMPIVGGVPSSFAEVVRLEPLRHTRLWAPLAEQCAIDILPAVRSVNCEVVRSVVDCSVLEIPSLDPMVKEKLMRPLGKKNLEVGLFVRGSAGSAKMTNSRLNLRTWSKLLVRFNLVVGRVVGKLLGPFVGFGLGHKIKGFRLGRLKRGWRSLRLQVVCRTLKWVSFLGSFSTSDDCPWEFSSAEDDFNLFLG
jgi:hypothetical protein